MGFTPDGISRIICGRAVPDTRRDASRPMMYGKGERDDVTVHGPSSGSSSPPAGAQGPRRGEPGWGAMGVREGSALVLAGLDGALCGRAPGGSGRISVAESRRGTIRRGVTGDGGARRLGRA